MLVQIETLKEYLGLNPDVEDATIDPVLERSSMLAQSLVESYVGCGLELEGAIPKAETRFQLEGVRVVRLRGYPVSVSSVKIDDVVVPAAEYTMDNALGVLQFTQQRSSVKKLEVKYASGYTAENLPADIAGAIANIALSIYENGGKINVQSSSGALKRMTMFDAMSMSFDTGGATDAVGTPQNLVGQWAFVLDKYRVDKYVMG